MMKLFKTKDKDKKHHHSPPPSHSSSAASPSHPSHSHSYSQSGAPPSHPAASAPAASAGATQMQFTSLLSQPPPSSSAAPPVSKPTSNGHGQAHAAHNQSGGYNYTGLPPIHYPGSSIGAPPGTLPSSMPMPAAGYPPSLRPQHSHYPGAAPPHLGGGGGGGGGAGGAGNGMFSPANHHLNYTPRPYVSSAGQTPPQPPPAGIPAAVAAAAAGMAAIGPTSIVKPSNLPGVKGRLTGDPKEDYPIVMAIDFGTTFSACAFAFRRDPEIQDVITWPKQAFQYPKVPTISLYKNTSSEFLDWGYPARAVMMTPNAKHHLLLAKFKLQLDDQQPNKEPLPLGIKPLDAISDYLRKFHVHIVKEAMKSFGTTYDQSHIQYCLTVPAMWSDRAKHVMRQAAVQAGLIKEDDPTHRLIIVSEPEAAAMYCQSKGEQFNLQKHDRFLICDAGGGTVDLIVFEVVDVNPETGIRSLREVTMGHGASCGSTFLDRNMENLLREKLAKYPLTPLGWGTLMDSFVNNTKPLFTGTESEMYLQVPNIPSLPDANDPEIGLDEGMLKLTLEELTERVFDPVVNDVLALIDYQLKQTHCEAIFLVGGFGSSRYLFDRVTAKFATPNRQVRVPPRAELAVVRGAVTYGLHQGSIISRVARRWYGVDSAMDFVPGVDPEEKKTLSRDGTVRCKDRFSVYISPGQSVAVGECVTKKYMTWCYPRPLDCPLYVSDSIEEPRYVDDPSVKKLGDFLIPMPEVPGMAAGSETLVEVRMHFGETEIRAEAIVLGNTVTAICQWIG